MSRPLPTVLTAAALTALAACATPAPTDGELLVIAATAVANEQRPSLTTAARHEIETALATDTARLRVVVTSPQRPTVIEDGDLRLRRGTQIEHDPTRRAELTTREVTRVGGVLGDAASQAPQLDLLGLLDYVARTPGKVTAVLISSGVQTTGPLALDRLGWDQVGTDAVIEQAQRDGLVPDLHGKRVVFTGLGEVDPPQETLPAPLRARLVQLWLKLCRAGGGDCVQDDEPVPGGTPKSTTPVPVVPVPHLPEITAPAAATPVELPSDILFGPDSAALLPDAAPVLDRLAAGFPRSAHAHLVGRTASVGPADTSRTLSLQRAEAVRDALVARGIPAAALTVEGVGYDRPLIADRDAAGNLIPAAAQRNRSVALTIGS
ncbi:OmpA family protein [Actinokineospora enzanensis]|uniref:OmpA family protein n=1 Tax=Actinokineospora enzanensis TaxID=155975 RepID=UPI000380CAEC|nr:OmpA family protein [Actinokineospora enzanensis]